jgi:hypothetical protein
LIFFSFNVREMFSGMLPLDFAVKSHTETTPSFSITMSASGAVTGVSNIHAQPGAQHFSSDKLLTQIQIVSGFEHTFCLSSITATGVGGKSLTALSGSQCSGQRQGLSAPA